MMTGDNLAVKHDGRVTRLTLDRPDRRNALGLATMRELIEAVETLPGETELVVLGAEGPVFSAGHDLSEMVGATEDRHRLLFDVCTEMMLALHRIPQPVVAQGAGTGHRCRLSARGELRSGGSGRLGVVRHPRGEDRAVLLDADGPAHQSRRAKARHGDAAHR